MGKGHDQLRILQVMTARRVFNLFQLRISYFLSRLTKKALHLGQPFTVSIEPTTACNLGCPECPSGLKQFTRPTGKIDLNFHQFILEQIAPTVFYINYYFQGEPFLHPHFLDLIKAAKKKKIYTATSTNAHFITAKKAEEIVASGLDRLIISIDGLTQETYENYRVHGQLQKVIEGTEFLVAAKQRMRSSTPHLIFQFLAVRPNEHEIKDVFKLGAQMGIDEVRIKTAQFYDYVKGNPLMPENETYSRYKKQKDGTYKLKFRTSNHCWRMWSGTVFTWDGKVVPCCFDKDAQHQVGDLQVVSFKSIWNSKRYKQFRQAVLRDRNAIDICQNCSEGAKVWA